MGFLWRDDLRTSGIEELRELRRRVICALSFFLRLDTVGVVGVFFTLGTCDVGSGDDWKRVFSTLGTGIIGTDVGSSCTLGSSCLCRVASVGVWCWSRIVHAPGCVG